MSQGAFILGLEGPVLSRDEAAFFRAANPWGFILFARNVVDRAQLSRLTADLRASVGRDAPILIDQEGGRVQRMRAPIWRDYLPPLDQSAQARDPIRAMYLRSVLLAHELAEVGIDVNCAPTLDVARAQTHPFLRNRTLSSDPLEIVDLARACLEGMAVRGVAGVIKHMPGHGLAQADSHHDLPVVTADRAVLEAVDFAPFRALKDSPMAMSAHLVYTALDPERPATQSPVMIDLIRREIGFGGLLMTDDISMNALAGDVSTRSHAALRAGCDVILHCNGKMDEMEAVAGLGAMSAPAQTRADAAARARPTARPVDIAALERDFQDQFRG
ncbi:Beta-hexosaminidase [Aquimixticola soesokkakensis]|uniref:beta-N-acetylhexosaminidase n=1 Tax=Aquimixticola soesokkakensis TaxID=1519096 RepID=A0A1Y5TMB0_9RHOB|nr:beta-N-acetylhexosaminidase [Aquimixticola soesokkakensis]SLN65290.1 Beta-hexosaminidase [Aquimixticola soesokkakensis]